ncbi:MAG TPA: amidohydrolase family protein [Myxococcota bacterium]|nr:amidohydrolase family protein [Myxococcota bacterium]
MTAPGRIDVHHHILPADYVGALAQLGVTGGGDIPFPRWDVESTLAMMDRQGIALAVTSISAPGLHFGDDRAARELARRCNEISAKLVGEHPTRFGAFAVLPLPDLDGALAELDYALGALRLDGVVLLSSWSDGSYLGDARYDELMSELHRRHVPIFVHPTVPKTSESIRLAAPGAAGEFVFDTTRAVMNLVFSGTLERLPGLSIILSHAGGTIPYLVGRVSLMGTLPHLRERAPKGVPHYLSRLHYDTALSANPNALRSLQELVGPDHILFGSDFPFAPEPVAKLSIDGLAAYPGFDAAARARIERENALGLLPSVAARLRAGR